MPAFLKRISDQLTELWQKFTKKQKIQIAVSLAIAIVALIALVFILSQPRMVLYDDELEPATINNIKEVLDSENIPYRINEEVTAVYVESSRKKDATLALQNKGILSQKGMDYKELFNNSITMTQYEKRLKYQIFFQAELARKIETIEAIEAAEVTLVLPEEDRTVLDENIKAKGTAVLTLKQSLTEEQVVGIASFLAGSVKNLSQDDVSIIDSSGRLLFDGITRTDAAAYLSINSDYEVQQELLMQQKIRSILLSRGEYDDAFVSVDLRIDFDEKTTIKELYSPEEGTNKGVISEEELRNAESTNTDIGEPVGTDANEETTDTFIGQRGNSSNSTEERRTKYKVDSEKSTIHQPRGQIRYDASAISVVLNKFKIYDQALLEKQGLLADTTWQNFKNENNVRKKLDVDPDVVKLIESASNNVSSLAVLAYEVPRFVDKTVPENSMNDYLLIALIVIMIGLLAFAIYKGTKSAEVTEIEPELSVEEMLETTKMVQDEMEPIEFESKSETRLQVEKFVDDNPEAAATLLRNWLNEQWEG